MKYRKFAISLVIALGFIFLSFAMAKANRQEEQVNNICAKNTNRMWGWTREDAWLSMTTTGDWKTDAWFYMLKAGEPVVVTKIDSEKGYYLVCYDFGSDTGWQPLVGWVYKDKILLQSQITPLAP